MKKKLCNISNNEELIRVTDILKKNSIDYFIKQNIFVLLCDIMRLFFYHVFSSGIEHHNKSFCIFVYEKDLDKAKYLIDNYFQEK